MDYRWLLVHISPSIGFLLALALMSHILREKRPPASTLAWLMAIIFIPYLGVPFYLIFGGRKMVKKTEKKKEFVQGKKQLHDFYDINPYLLRSEAGIYPPSANNQVTFLPNGEQAFESIIDLILSARHTIYIATFILGKDKTGESILHALAQKASQGVNVFLLLDALGSVRVTKRFLSPLINAGGQVAFFMPMFHLPFRGRANLRNHRKMLICDHQTAIIGGMNLAAEYMGPQTITGRWRDLSLIVQGLVIEHIIDTFRSDWEFASKVPLQNNFTLTHKVDDTTAGIVQLVASGPDVPNDSLRNAILANIFKAKRRIRIVTPYFIPDEFLLESLCIAVHRGVDVSIITPVKSNHRLADLVREGYLNRLQDAGAAVWLFKPCMLHAKAILFDDMIAIVGSANMDMRSMLLNYEIAMCLYDSKAIEQIQTWMLDLKASCLVRKRQTRRALELLEGVGRIFAPLL